KDPATVTYYTLTQVPTQIESRKRDILDKLNEVKTAANGKIVLEIIDPSDNKDLVEKLKKEGFELQFQDFNKDQVNISKIYSGLKITYQDKPTANFQKVETPEQIELELGSILMELSLDKKPVV